MDGDDSDGGQPPADRPGPVIVPPPARPKGRKPPREAVYLEMWAAYKDGTRSKEELRKKFNCGWAIIDHTVEHGWPEHGWPSLRSRLELWERQRDAVRAKEIEKRDVREAVREGKEEARTWKTFQPRAIKAVVEGQALLETLAVKLREAAKAATFVKYRQVTQVLDQPDGSKKVVKIDQPYVDGLSVASAARLWAGAAKECGQLMSFLTGGPSQRTEVTIPDFTPDQIAQLAQGKLPEGVTLVQVAQAVLAAETNASVGVGP